MSRPAESASSSSPERWLGHAESDLALALLAQGPRLVEEAGLEVPESVTTVGLLTPYAVQTRYPGEWEEISDEELVEATHVAAEVLAWARSLAVAEEQSDTTADVDSPPAS